MKSNERIFCNEAFEGNDLLLKAVERLYLATQHPEERIPWGWIARSLKGRAARRPGVAGSHLLTAVPEEHAVEGDPEELAGFAYGSFLPEYGGYLSYLGVDERFRKRGVGTRLMTQMVKVLHAEAGAMDEPLPFVVWESKRPSAEAPPADHRLWDARLKLFERVGGRWLEGLELFTPNYGDDQDGKPVVLQLFVRPVDRSLEGFDRDFLRSIATGLLERVYRLSADDPLLIRTMATTRRLRLRPAGDAIRRPVGAA